MDDGGLEMGPCQGQSPYMPTSSTQVEGA
ncbi:hypothetical protein FRAHR75_20037 [Frankia sp. Hr75.2]|nr:hypothetical protein FRAHR75_20037 [Frankia sp. Hr75.2]